MSFYLEPIYQALRKVMPDSLQNLVPDLSLYGAALGRDLQDALVLLNGVIQSSPPEQWLLILARMQGERIRSRLDSSKPVIMFLENNTFSWLVADYARSLQKSGRFQILYVVARPEASRLAGQHDFESFEFAYAHNPGCYGLLPRPSMVFASEFLSDHLAAYSGLPRIDVSHFLEVNHPLELQLYRRLWQARFCTHLALTRTLSDDFDVNTLEGALPVHVVEAGRSKVTLMPVGYPRIGQYVNADTGVRRHCVVLHVGKSSGDALQHVREVAVKLRNLDGDLQIHVRPFPGEENFPIFAELENQDTRLKVDRGARYDLDAYVHSKVICIFGDSKTMFSYTWGTGNPVVLFDDTGEVKIPSVDSIYRVQTAQEAVDQLQKLLENQTSAGNKESRACLAAHVQDFDVNLAAAVDAILKNERLADWQDLTICSHNMSGVKDAKAMPLALSMQKRFGWQTPYPTVSFVLESLLACNPQNPRLMAEVALSKLSLVAPLADSEDPSRCRWYRDLCLETIYLLFRLAGSLNTHAVEKVSIRERAQWIASQLHEL